MWLPPSGPRPGVKQGHGSFGKVAAFADLPFIVGFHKDGTGEAEQRLRVGEDTDNVGAALDFLVQPRQRDSPSCKS